MSTFKIQPPAHSKPIKTDWTPSPGFVQAVQQELGIDAQHAQIAVKQISEICKRMGYDISQIPEKTILVMIQLTNKKLNQQKQVNTAPTGQTNG